MSDKKLLKVKKRMSMHKIIVISLFLFSLNSILSQSFSDNREKFIKELQKSLSGFADKEQNDFVKKELTTILMVGSKFPESYFKKLVQTCNLMEEKKLKPVPEIYNYIFSVYSFIENNQPESSYDAWHSSIDKLLEARNVSRFKDFIEVSAGFFSERSLHKASNFDWYYKGGSYSFEYTDKPFIRCENGNLVCLVENSGARKKDDKYVDSIVVYGTNGVYDPILRKWEGTGGTITWEKVGFNKNETFAEIRGYNFSLKSSNFNCDTVTLTTPYFDKPILGQLSERAFKINREEDKIFPKFISFNKNHSIKQIVEDVDYKGGFSLEGGNFVGLGSGAEPSSLIVYRNAKEFIKVQSRLLTVNDKKILSRASQISIYIGLEDSIYHPGVDFTYLLDKKVIEFTRGQRGLSEAPFTNSYHQVDMFVPKLVWKKDAQEIDFTYDFGVSQEQRIARLESRDYFDGRLYDQLQTMENVHPLVSIFNYCTKYDEFNINEGKLASAMNKTVEQAKPEILKLASLGFITYDPETKNVSVNQKVINFINSRSGKKDYDNLNFISDMRPKSLSQYTDKEIKNDPNLARVDEIYKRQNKERSNLKNFGVFSLSTMEINLDAVDQVEISQAQNTIVYPENGKIVLKKNRDFDFNGWMTSGKLEINALAANYVYEKHKINLLKTNQTAFRVRPLTEKDGKQSILMGSVISEIQGEILVNQPDNRAGLNKKITEYPKLNSTKPTKVFYNQKNIYKGAYDSTRFYYELEPFTLDSLTNFKESSLRFKGQLVSAGIFPSFKEDLLIMPDYSFGFSTKTPEGGYDFYSKKGKYDNKIVLSNNGLQGAGVINYIESSSTSKLFTFLPDSTIGYAQFINRPVDEGIQFPDVTCENAYVAYIPEEGVLKASSTNKLLIMFKEEVKMRGTVIIRPEGMKGMGIMNLPTSNLGSDDFDFTRWAAIADTANFNLKNKYPEDDEDPLSFKTENVKANVDFSTRKGTFLSNTGSTVVELPINQYICKMDFFTWFMDEEEIEMAAKKGDEVDLAADLDLTGSNFYSTHPDQDSLNFRAPIAKFTLKEKTVYCSKTEYIDVADARIFPDSMKVTIRKKARMDPLDNSVIVANYITKYHRFINAKTRIQARRAYTSEADYPYYDYDSVERIIHMSKIYLDSSFETTAIGKVTSKQGFKLSKEFDYYGDVKIVAILPLISFSGATRINHECEKFEKSWMSFEASIDPKNIQIPVSADMKTLEGNPITAGIVWRDSRVPDSIRLYPTFLSALKDPKDPVLITSSGVLQYDALMGEFQIASKEKLINRGEKGNFIALHTESCSLNGDGKIDLGMDYGDVKLDAIGVVNYNQENNKTSMNVTARIDMPIDKNSFESVAGRIKAIEELKPMDFGSTTIEQALVEWTDVKTADKFKSDYTLKGEVRSIPDPLEKAIVLTGLRLESFNDKKLEEKGLITTSESVAIVNMYGKAVLKYVPLKAFFQQIYSGNASGDKLGLFISIPSGSDYYFDYEMGKKNGELKIITTDNTYQSTLEGIKDDKRKSGNFKYEYSSNTIFLSKFKRLFGNEEE
jgi:hypothetical protein